MSMVLIDQDAAGAARWVAGIDSGDGRETGGMVAKNATPLPPFLMYSQDGLLSMRPNPYSSRSALFTVLFLRGVGGFSTSGDAARLAGDLESTVPWDSAGRSARLWWNMFKPQSSAIEGGCKEKKLIAPGDSLAR